MPTLGLATATAFHCLTDRERQFPVIRLFGTLGWIAAGILVSYVLEADRTALPMHGAGIAGLLMGFYSFTLPSVPPPAAGQKVSFRDIIGIDALHKLNSSPFVVFMISLLLTSIPLATYYAYVPVFLNDAKIANPAFVPLLFAGLVTFAFAFLFRDDLPLDREATRPAMQKV